MSGPGEGKFLLKNCKVYLKDGKKEAIPAKVYIHLKGYSLAKVTHLDVEHNFLNEIISPKRGYFLNVQGTGRGIEIKLNSKSVLIFHPYLKILKKGEKVRAWVGGKIGGIYIGLKKAQIERLEEIVKKKFDFKN